MGGRASSNLKWGVPVKATLNSYPVPTKSPKCSSPKP